MPPFEHLFEPLNLRGHKIRNRILSTGHQTYLAKGGLVSEDLVAYHEARARGGVGLIIAEAARFHPTALTLLWQIRFVLLDRRSGPKGTSSTAARVEERDHGRAYGWKARLRRWTARLFSPDWPLEGAGAGGRGRRPCS